MNWWTVDIEDEVKRRALTIKEGGGEMRGGSVRLTFTSEKDGAYHPAGLLHEEPPMVLVHPYLQ
jgi:hypothetical protein